MAKKEEIGNNYPGEDYYKGYALDSEGMKKLIELENEREARIDKINNDMRMFEEDKGKLESKFDWKGKLDFVKKAYKQEDKIQEIINRLYSVEISNIRNVSLDKENKKCECEATFKWVESEEEWGHRNRSKEIYFTAQRNTDGDLYIQVMR